MIDAKSENDSSGDVGERYVIPVQVLLCLATYAIIWRCFLFMTVLPRSAYERPVILVAALSNPQVQLLLGLGALLLIVRRRQITWASIDPDFKAKRFVMLLLAPLVVQFVFYDYNYFFDQSHLVDRLAIVVLWLLIALHPAFIFPLTCLVMFVLYQFFHPLPGGGANWPDKLLPMHLLFLLDAFLLVRLFVRLDRSTLLLSTLVMAGGFYAHSAYSKLLLGPYPWSWLLEDQTNYLFVAAYKNGGWLAGLGDATIVKLAVWMQPLSVAQNVITLLIEGGAILLLWNRWTTRVGLAACIALHLAILASSSIFFWKWMLVDVVLLVYAEQLWRSEIAVSSERITRKLLVVLTIVFTCFKMYSEGPLFAWWDTRHCKYFTYEVETTDGQRLSLDPHYFAPYDLTFVQSRYYYAVPRKVLPGTFGVNFDIEATRALNANRIEEFPAILEKYGQELYQPESAATYRDFLQTYVTNAMKRDRKRFLPWWCPPPYHFQSSVPDEAYQHDVKVVKLFVYFEEYFFDDHAIHQLSRTELMQIPIPKD